MKKFLIKILFFLIPPILYVLLTLVIDPYNFYKNTNTIDLATKKRIAYPLNYPLWKSLEYKKSPVENILLGDSRTNALNTEKIKKVSGLDFYNFAYGGGTLPEIIETFWFAQGHTKLKNVYVGINLNLYNALNERNRVTGAIKLHSSFVNYSFSKFVFKSNWYILNDILLKRNTQIGKPKMTKEEFWKYQLTVSASNFYKRYRYPSEYFEELQEIVAYCDENNVNIVFFIPPTHVNLQNQIDKHLLTKENLRFKSDLKKLGKVIDLNFPNDFTRNKANFKDPFHPKSDSILLVNLFKGGI